MQNQPVCRIIIDILEIKVHIHTIKKQARQEIVDYQFLMSALKAYSRPRDKISSWLKSGELIRVKKGLYVFGEDTGQGLYSKEILANLIYGPSALSLQYALAYYQFIPDQVTTVTSITPKRNKIFNTPVGRFTYKYLHPRKYAVGIEFVALSSTERFLIASPEKALCDQIHIIDNSLRLDHLEEIEAYLTTDLRIDMDLIKQLEIKKLTELSQTYQDKRLMLLTQFIKKWKKSRA